MRIAVAFALAHAAAGFVQPSLRAPATFGPRMSLAHEPETISSTGSFAPIDFSRSNTASMDAGKAASVAAVGMLPFLLNVGEASAKGGELGIWEGRTAALVHPIIMGTLFALSGYAALLGLQYRELRTMGTQLNRLKEQLPTLSSGEKAAFPISKNVAAIQKQIKELEEGSSEVSALKADLAKLEAAAKIDQEYRSYSDRRKELSNKNVRDKHYEMGSLILGLGTFAAIEGPANTYVRAGKLFPGPHLYAGAGIVIAWAIAASLVQQMQKGNDAARIAHISINFGILGFFAWQVGTGLEIVKKVLEFTKWP